MHTPYQMTAINMGIDTHQEPVVYMRDDCHICRAEGFSASSRVRIEYQDEKLTATLNNPDSLPLSSDTNSLSQQIDCTIECPFSCSTPCGVTPAFTSKSHFNRMNMPDSYMKAALTSDIAPLFQKPALRPPIA